MERLRRATLATPHVSDWSLAPRSTKAMALLVLLCLLVGIFLLQLAGHAYEVQGPTRIARHTDGSVLIGAYEKLFLLDAEQHLTKLIAKELGLVGPVNSITADNTDWLLGDDDSGLLYRCDALLRQCHPLFAGRSERMFSRAHSVVKLDDRLIISDSERHRLRVFDREGKELLVTRTEPVALCYPNDVILVDDQLYVTDTNNFRIAKVDPQTFRSETFIQTSAGKPFKRANCADVSSKIADRGDAYANLILDASTTIGRLTRPIARHNRVLPASVLHDSRTQWWVVQMKGKMELGDVIVYSSAGEPLKRIALPEDSEPTNLLEAPEGILITDPRLARIYTVSLDGALLGDWGSAELKKEWQSILTARARWELAYPIGLGAIALCVLLAIVVVVREVVRTRGNIGPNMVRLAPTDALPQPLNSPESWISLDVGYLKLVRRMRWITRLTAVVAISVTVYLLFDLTDGFVRPLSRPEAISFMFVAAYTLVAVLALIWGTYKEVAQPKRIGTNGRELLYDPGNGKIVASEFGDVLAAGHQLLVGKQLVMVRTNHGKPVFPVEQLAALILARIPKPNFVSQWKLTYEALRRGNLALRCFVLFLTLFALFEIGKRIFHADVEPIKQSISMWLIGK